MTDVKVFTIDQAYEDIVKAKKIFGQTRSSGSVLRDVAASISGIKKPKAPPKEGEPVEKSKGPWKRGKKGYPRADSEGRMYPLTPSNVRAGVKPVSSMSAKEVAKLNKKLAPKEKERYKEWKERGYGD